jgi:ATP-dependent DNA helicase DinG
MRQRAADSELVVVNHHLLFADAAVRQGNYGAVIPERDVAVLDEAHQLEDVATSYFGLSVSHYRLADLARDVTQAIEPWPAPERRDAVRRMAARVDDRSRQFFDVLQPRRRGGEDRIRITADALADVQPLGQALLGTLEGLEAQLQLLKSAPSDEAGTVRPAIVDELMNLAGRIAELRVELTILLRASDPDYVFFLESRARGLFLRAAPIDVSRIVREELVDRFHATVLTSATMAVDGGFDYIRGRLGIRNADETRLPSEFDYATQTILYLPRRMPLPKDPGFADAAARQCLEILQRTEGRAFVLFTSYAMLRAVEPHLRLGLRYPLLVQGTAPRGAQLSCVIIDKLPFASPADPVTAARMESLAERGGDAFGDYQVPLAILTLLQGLGRLIRHRSDRGVLAVLDPRIRSMGYGRRFLASLPPAPVVYDLDAIRRFFER